jgi:phosphotransferase family enzyme
LKQPASPDPNGADSKPHNPQVMAAELEPAMRDACDGKLGQIEWFRSPWQQGGAATGFSTWTNGDGSIAETLVKLPVGAHEHHWTTALSNARCAHTPKVIADGTTLGHYDLAWLVVERLRGKTVGKDLSRDCVHALLDATCDMHRLAADIRPVRDHDKPDPPDWGSLIERAREAVKDNRLEHEQRWNEALKKVQKRLKHLVSDWRARTMHTWCHGDLHPGNALYRGPREHEGDVVLIDLALVHAGHWIEDALYLERLYWGHESMLHGVKPVSMLAKLRKSRGLRLGEDYSHLANIRRLLMAACVPAFLGREGNPVYVEASLGILERLGRDALR